MAERDMRWEASAGGRLEFVVQPLREVSRIREVLRPRVEYTAYALGQLEPGLYERTRWFRAVGKSGTALVLHSQGGLGDATFVMGEPDAARAILTIHPGAAQTYITCQPQHVPALKAIYRLAVQQPMIRMGVRRETFRPLYTVPTVALGGMDIRRINQLYSTEAGPSYYVPEHIENGVYRGVVVGGQLVAIAGTHVVSRQEGVAVVGNVFTHPAHRGKGYGTVVTSAVTQVLLEYCDHVVLTVDPGNQPAIKAYDRLGYREVCQLVEASAARKDPVGISVWWKRWRASMRGRRYDGALVRVRGRRE